MVEEGVLTLNPSHMGCYKLVDKDEARAVRTRTPRTKSDAAEKTAPKSEEEKTASKSPAKSSPKKTAAKKAPGTCIEVAFRAHLTAMLYRNRQEADQKACCQEDNVS